MAQTAASEHTIQNHLYWLYHSSSALVLPNYTPVRWWECDFFRITRAGYFLEYEIKRTVADFQKDKKKKSTRWTGGMGRPFKREHDKKHDLLAAGSTRGPKQFWYVVPTGLVAAEDVPGHAGLIYMDGSQEEKPAPILHRNKVDDDVLTHARSVCYHHFWHERIQRSKEKAQWALK